MTYQETSRIAYRHDALPTLGDRQRVVYEAIQTRENFTNSELSAYLVWPINTITPRIFELRKLGLVIEDCKRRCRVTGRMAIAWTMVKNTLF